MSYLYIFLGGGLGSVIRFVISTLAFKVTSVFWVGTIIVNVVGSLLIISGEKKGLFEIKALDPLIRVGFLGGLTTFSTLSFEFFNLVKSGNIVHAMACLGLNIVFGILIIIWMFR